jgi:flagellar basal body-associated protein FliL
MSQPNNPATTPATSAATSAPGTAQSATPGATSAPATPTTRKSAGAKGPFARELTLIVALVLTVLLAAGWILYATWGHTGLAKAEKDQKLVAVITAANSADRAYYTEGQDRLIESQGYGPANVELTDKYTKQLADAVKAYGLDNLDIPADPKDEDGMQLRLLFEDPVKRVEETRETLGQGYLPDQKAVPTFDAMRGALEAFEAKAPALLQDTVLSKDAKTFADQVESDGVITRIDREIEGNDPSETSLAQLKKDASGAVASAQGLPETLMLVSIVLSALAVIAWAVFFIGSATFWKGAVRVKAPKAPKTPKAPKADKASKPDADAAPKAKPIAFTPVKTPANADAAPAAPAASSAPASPASPAAPAPTSPAPGAPLGQSTFTPPEPVAAPAAPAATPAPAADTSAPEPKKAGPRIPWRSPGGSDN